MDRLSKTSHELPTITKTTEAAAVDRRAGFHARDSLEQRLPFESRCACRSERRCFRRTLASALANSTLPRRCGDVRKWRSNARRSACVSSPRT